MNTAVALVLAVAAVAIVVSITSKQEQAAAMQATAITKAKNSAKLGLGDILTIGAVAGATAAAGPAGGRAAIGLTGARL